MRKIEVIFDGRKIQMDEKEPIIAVELEHLEEEDNYLYFIGALSGMINDLKKSEKKIVGK